MAAPDRPARVAFPPSRAAVALICRWASRTLIGRKLKGLEDTIYVSADILRMMNSGFDDLADPTFDLYPTDLREEIDALNARVYPRLNNDVYRAGFATTQVAYEEAFNDVFGMPDDLEARLSDGRDLLFGERLTEADVRLFVTLVRFDVAYHGLFKCNLRRIADYPALSAYQARILALPGIRETVSIDHIKRGYHSIKALNPTGIVPVGPVLSAALRLARASALLTMSCEKRASVAAEE